MDDLPIICTECPFKASCYGGRTRWNSGRGPASTEDAPITLVHTCRSCGVRKLTYFSKRDPAFDDIAAPKGCPRWHPNAGCMLDCNACTDERDAIRKAHPLYEQRTEAVMRMFQGVFGGDKPSEQEQDQAIRDYLNLTLPGRGVHIMDRWKPALDLASFLLSYVSAQFDDPFGVLGPDERRDLVYGWTEYLFLSMRRHLVDPDAVVREFVLKLTENRWGGRAWSSLPLEVRERHKAAWAAQVRRVMGIQEPARC